MPNLGIDMQWFISVILLIIGGYLLGSIPSAYLAGKWIRGIDLREYGSGTVSGSMVWEHVAKWAIAPVGLFDIFKGFLPTWLTLRFDLGESAAVMVGLAAVIGHNWPLYLNFQGGRGLSPFLGNLLALFPLGCFIMLLSLGIGYLLTFAPLPLITILLMPVFANIFNGPSVILELSVGMLLITLCKRLEANRRPLPKDPEERKKVIFLRIFYDRDIQDQKEWIRREPKNQTSLPQHKEP